VPVQVRHDRNRILRNLSYRKMQDFTARHTGQVRKVLFEGHEKNGLMEGYTDNYIRVSAAFDPEKVNQVIDWQL
jgi:threonylcarbamoyladenosine tRNA methylthiotransferase MtaB